MAMSNICYFAREPSKWKVSLTDRLTDRLTNQPTNQLTVRVTFGVVCTRLKTFNKAVYTAALVADGWTGAEDHEK